jgi:hypothetical protein
MAVARRMFSLSLSASKPEIPSMTTGVFLQRAVRHGLPKRKAGQRRLAFFTALHRVTLDTP